MSVITLEYAQKGDQVALKDKNGVQHSFYVLEDGTDTVKLIAKENINTTTLLQEDANLIAFSSTNYWADEEGNILDQYEGEDFMERGEYYNLIETGVPDTNHYAAYAAYQYGTKFENATGRLLYFPESIGLPGGLNGGDIDGSMASRFSFWFGTAGNANSVWAYFYIGMGDYGTDRREYQGSFDGPHAVAGVRPVLEITKSK